MLKRMDFECEESAEVWEGLVREHGGNAAFYLRELLDANPHMSVEAWVELNNWEVLWLGLPKLKPTPPQRK
jgi:hypothetical protein